MNEPSTLAEAIRHFADIDVATDYVAKLRWPDGFVCPHCGSREYSYVSTRRLWKCKFCKKQSSVKVGTIFEGSSLGLDKWLPAIWLVANSESELGSAEVAEALGTTEKSARLMLQRIRDAMPSVHPVGEPVETPHPMDQGQNRSWVVALALGMFAFGVLVGRLTKR